MFVIPEHADYPYIQNSFDQFLILFCSPVKQNPINAHAGLLCDSFSPNHPEIFWDKVVQ